ARMLNVRFPENFDSPYKARGPIEFWRRWHITLSFFLRDYLYIPLGGNRCGKLRQHFNLFMTMLISGLWHGANWTFVIWGALHGMYYLVWRSLEPVAANVKRRVRAISPLLFRLPMNGARLAPVAIVPEPAAQHERLKPSIAFAAYGALSQMPSIDGPQTGPSGV